MDPLILARWQFALTTVYHFFFVPLTLGLSVLIAIMETIYVRTGKTVYKQMAKFWGKLFLINFAIGVATGIVQEFQFGMNWAEYSRFVGDIFGAPLAIEALLAFFLESVFLGVWIFGWDKLSKKMHAATIWLVAIASNLSALWILVANSFMQQPVGFVLRNGRAEMVDFFALLFNPNLWEQFPHVVFGGFTTAAFFVMGISAYHLWKRNNLDMFQRSFQIAAIVGAMSIVLVILKGHGQAQHMVINQPMKMAAAEALWDTESPASFSLLTIGDLTLRNEVFSIRIPRVLSLLSYNQLEGEVKGINDLQAAYEQTYGPGNYIPPVAIIYWAFRLMVGAGTLMLVLAVYALFLVMRREITFNPVLQKIYLLAIGLPILANSSGWILTEVGRMPWVVFGVMKVGDAVSSTVSGGMVLTTLIGYILLYSLLIMADVYLLVKYARNAPPEDNGKAVASTDTELPSLVGV